MRKHLIILSLSRITRFGGIALHSYSQTDNETKKLLSLFFSLWPSPSLTTHLYFFFSAHLHFFFFVHSHRSNPRLTTTVHWTRRPSCFNNSNSTRVPHQQWPTVRRCSRRAMAWWLTCCRMMRRQTRSMQRSGRRGGSRWCGKERIPFKKTKGEEEEQEEEQEKEQEEEQEEEQEQE